jgi:hypothetical protein
VVHERVVVAIVVVAGFVALEEGRRETKRKEQR